jgi:hypothetical protein
MEMEEVEEQASAAYATLEEDTASRDGDVITQLELLISDLLPLVTGGGAASAADPAAAPVDTPATTEAAVAAATAAATAEEAAAREAEAILEEGKQERLRLHGQLAKLQEMLDVQAKKQEERKQNAARLRAINTAFERYIADISLDDLPELPVPKGQQLAKQAQLHSLFAHWHANGMTSTFCFADLVKHSALGTEAPNFVKTILGEKWIELFPTEPEGADTMPRQVAQLIFQSLARLGKSWEKANQDQKTKDAAKDSYAAMEGEAKRRRAEIMDAAMD